MPWTNVHELNNGWVGWFGLMDECVERWMCAWIDVCMNGCVPELMCAWMGMWMTVFMDWGMGNKQPAVGVIETRALLLQTSFDIALVSKWVCVGHSFHAAVRNKSWLKWTFLGSLEWCLRHANQRFKFLLQYKTEYNIYFIIPPLHSPVVYTMLSDHLLVRNIAP